MAKKKPAPKTSAAQRQKTVSVKKIVAEINRTLAKLEPAKAATTASGPRRPAARSPTRSTAPSCRCAARGTSSKAPACAWVRHPPLARSTRAPQGPVRSAAWARRGALSPIGGRRCRSAARRPGAAPVRARTRTVATAAVVALLDVASLWRQSTTSPRRCPERQLLTLPLLRALLRRGLLETSTAAPDSRDAAAAAWGAWNPAAGFFHDATRGRPFQSPPTGQRRAAATGARGATARGGDDAARRRSGRRLRVAATGPRLRAGDDGAGAAVLAAPRPRAAAPRRAGDAAGPDLGRPGVGRRRWFR